MVAVGDLAVLVEVRDVGKFRAHPPLLPHREVAARVHRAERGGEGELLVLRQVLTPEHQHGVSVHRRFDLLCRRRGERRAQVDPLGERG